MSRSLARHLTLIVAVYTLVVLFLGFAAGRASAHDIYTDWKMPDSPNLSCCNGDDCRPTPAPTWATMAAGGPGTGRDGCSCHPTRCSRPTWRRTAGAICARLLAGRCCASRRESRRCSLVEDAARIAPVDFPRWIAVRRPPVVLQAAVRVLPGAFAKLAADALNVVHQWSL